MTDTALVQPTVVEIEESYKLLRRRTAWFVGIVVALLINAGFTGFAYTQIRANQATLTQLQDANTALQKTQAQQAAASAEFIHDFLAQQEYTCRIVTALAAKQAIPTPSSTACHVPIPGK